MGTFSFGRSAPMIDVRWMLLVEARRTFLSRGGHRYATHRLPRHINMSGVREDDSDEEIGPMPAPEVQKTPADDGVPEGVRAFLERERRQKELLTVRVE